MMKNTNKYVVYFGIGILFGSICTEILIRNKYDTYTINMFLLAIVALAVTWMYNSQKVEQLLYCNIPDFVFYKILNPSIIFIGATCIIIFIIFSSKLTNKTEKIILFFTGAAVLLNTREVYVKNRIQFYNEYTNYIKNRNERLEEKIQSWLTYADDQIKIIGGTSTLKVRELKKIRNDVMIIKNRLLYTGKNYSQFIEKEKIKDMIQKEKLFTSIEIENKKDNLNNQQDEMIKEFKRMVNEFKKIKEI